MEVSIAQNADINRILTNGVIAVDRAFDIAFLFTQCTSFKLQGSSDGGNSYADIAGTSSLMGAAGTYTAGTAYTLSLTRCRFDHLKAVFSGTNPTCIAYRGGIRQSPKIGRDKTIQLTIVDPALGTA